MASRHGIAGSTRAAGGRGAGRAPAERVARPETRYHSLPRRFRPVGFAAGRLGSFAVGESWWCCCSTLEVCQRCRRGFEPCPVPAARQPTLGPALGQVTGIVSVGATFCHRG